MLNGFARPVLAALLHAGRSPGGQQGPTDGQLGGQVTLSRRLAGNTKEGWAGSCGATECECARLVMAAVSALEGEADRLCVLLVQPVRHLAAFSLLELLAVSVLIREMFFLLSSVFRGGS